jgi:hypothetical protein
MENSFSKIPLLEAARRASTIYSIHILRWMTVEDVYQMQRNVMVRTQFKAQPEMHQQPFQGWTLRKPLTFPGQVLFRAMM